MTGNWTVLVTREGMGEAEGDLPVRLFQTYCRLLLENGTLPGVIAFYTNGVRLCVEGSPALGVLEELEKRGVHLVLCKTCLDSFGLLDKVRVGVVGGMGDILAAQLKAEKVVAL
jgi:sulfur relay (sulfurtransferase) complex TusBCD TusD component (DsrE family)